MTRLPGINDQVRVESAVSEGFSEWISRAGGTLVVSTYQAGKVAMIGWDGRRVNLLMRQFDKPLGLAVQGRRIVLATRNDVIFFADAPALAEHYLEGDPGRYDALFLPRVTYHTGDLNTHDVAFQGDDVILVNTRFSCLARLSATFNFTPFWRPAFVSDLVPEDRCHLNGLAMRDGRPAYVTALGTTDAAGAWRANKAQGGVLLDVDSGQVIRDGLSMPHSPRWHNGRLWVLNSGTGELWIVDPANGHADVVCELPGYLRGLCFAGPYAVIGLSKIREKHIFGGLPVQKRCSQLLCGLAVIDLRSGAPMGMFEYTVGCEELYDIQFLPGLHRPMILNLEKAGAREAMTNPDCSFWLRSSAEIPLDANASKEPAGELASPRSSGRQGTDTLRQDTLLPDSGTSL